MPNAIPKPNLMKTEDDWLKIGRWEFSKVAIYKHRAFLLTKNIWLYYIVEIVQNTRQQQEVYWNQNKKSTELHLRTEKKC